ncbi:MAG: hypothetical protein NZ823_12465, partial [Blastocatellia bacterium]|nr:hypothetical protein [Blastocatellia bacterium]
GILPASDDDPYPSTTNGIDGDNLSAYEEYRGFVVLSGGIDRHRRTNPSNKDLFIWSDVFSDNVYDATNLPFPKHRVTNAAKDANRRINFNRNNSGYGGPIPGTDRRCLVVVKDDMEFRDVCFGQGFPDGAPRPPNGMDRLEIYIRNHRWASPPTYHPDIPEPLDDEGIKHTQGHEVGHGINIPHRAPISPLSVMIIDYLTPGFNVESDMQRWTNMPHNDVIPHLRLK